LNPIRTVQVDIRERYTNVQVTFGVTVSYSTATGSGTFFWPGGSLFEWAVTSFGSYTFSGSPGQGYYDFTQVETVNQGVLIVLLVEFCGDGVCNPEFENGDFCFLDCVSLFLEFENADGSGPVNSMTVNYYLEDPRDANAQTGPNKNGATISATRGTGSASNTVLQTTYGYDQMVWVESVNSRFINFYWTIDASDVDPNLGVFRLRVHASTVLTGTNMNYRFVNTWRPIDDEPSPFAPTDLNLHLFHPQDALDINHPTLISNGFTIGTAIADSKQSGGPATMDISPGANQMVAVWNTKPPRSRAIAPSQSGRFLVNSGSYVVVYGKTSNAGSGKQLGEVTLKNFLDLNPQTSTSDPSDLWYIMQFTTTSPGINQPQIVAQNRISSGTVTSSLDLVFNCEAYDHCASFVVPYSDTGR
jgi:hypothetical protein